MPRSLSFVFLLLLTAPASAQPERYELGRRLKAFEAAWEKQDNPAARERALAGLPKITAHFFSGQLGEAGRALDLAAYLLTTDVLPSAGRQWVWSLYAVPEARVVDGSAKEITVTIQPFYPVKGDLPKGLELQLWFTNKDVVRVKPEKFPLTVKVPLPSLGEFRGLDRKLYFLVDGAKELRPTAIGISQIADLQNRIDAVRGAPVRKTITIEEATSRHRAGLASAASGGSKGPSFPPTDMPYADLLANAETMLDGKPFFTIAKHGQFWMTVPVRPKASVDCRVFIPKGLDKTKPVPVVFALHGMGVDENMYFESYGAGQIVKECEERGWVLVCPRSSVTDFEGPPIATLQAALTERYPLDPKRVFVVGHSMGALQAIGQAAEGKFAGVAVLGGGGALAKKEAFATLPLFIGVGDKDALALSGARALNKSLTSAGAKAVIFKEYSDVEHLVIVRAALPDVFAMFDKVAGK